MHHMRQPLPRNWQPLCSPSNMYNNQYHNLTVIYALYHPTPNHPDKAVQDAADKSNWGTAHARVVKLQVIAPITPTNYPIITSKYSKRICRGWSQAAQRMKNAETPATSTASPPKLLELPSDSIASIQHQNKGRANRLVTDSIDVFICLAK